MFMIASMNILEKNDVRVCGEVKRRSPITSPTNDRPQPHPKK
jgi:hypothetical protein